MDTKLNCQICYSDKKYKDMINVHCRNCCSGSDAKYRYCRECVLKLINAYTGCPTCHDIQNFNINLIPYFRNGGFEIYKEKNGQMHSFKIVQGDISDIECDYLVNSCPEDLRILGYGVNYAIKKTAGYKYQESCNKIMSERYNTPLNKGEIIEICSGELYHVKKCILNVHCPNKKEINIYRYIYKQILSKFLRDKNPDDPLSYIPEVIVIPLLGSGTLGLDEKLSFDLLIDEYIANIEINSFSQSQSHYDKSRNVILVTNDINQFNRYCTYLDRLINDIELKKEYSLKQIIYKE